MSEVDDVQDEETRTSAEIYRDEICQHEQMQTWPKCVCQFCHGCAASYRDALCTRQKHKSNKGKVIRFRNSGKTCAHKGCRNIAAVSVIFPAVTKGEPLALPYCNAHVDAGVEIAAGEWAVRKRLDDMDGKGNGTADSG